ncbi:hypothetical protein [Bacillus sp. AK031]
MENKPLHYDGSIADHSGNANDETAERFIISAEARKNIAGNPYELNTEE